MCLIFVSTRKALRPNQSTSREKTRHLITIETTTEIKNQTTVIFMWCYHLAQSLQGEIVLTDNKRPENPTKTSLLKPQNVLSALIYIMFYALITYVQYKQHPLLPPEHSAKATSSY